MSLVQDWWHCVYVGVSGNNDYILWINGFAQKFFWNLNQYCRPKNSDFKLLDQIGVIYGGGQENHQDIIKQSFLLGLIFASLTCNFSKSPQDSKLSCLLMSVLICHVDIRWQKSSERELDLLAMLRVGDGQMCFSDLTTKWSCSATYDTKRMSSCDVVRCSLVSLVGLITALVSLYLPFNLTFSLTKNVIKYNTTSQGSQCVQLWVTTVRSTSGTDVWCLSAAARNGLHGAATDTRSPPVFLLIIVFI